MKATNSTPVSPLHAIPPQTQTQKPVADRPKTPEQKKTIPPPTETPQPSGASRIIWTIAIAMGFVTLSYLSIPNYVTGEAEITSRDRARTKLTMPETGIVHIKIDNHARVYPGQIVAEIVSVELEDKLADTKRSRERTQGRLLGAKENLKIAEAQLATAKTDEAMAKNRAEEKQQELRSLLANGIPESRNIEREQESIQQEILGIENEILATQNQIGGIDLDLQKIAEQTGEARERLGMYLDLVQQGVYGEKHQQIFELKNQIRNLERERENAQTQQKILSNQIQRSQAAIRQKQKQIEGRGEQISLVQKQIQERWQEYQREVNLKSAQKQSSQTRVKAARSEIITLERELNEWDNEITRFKDRKNKLILIAKTPGTAITKNLDLKNNTTLQKGEEILSIADLKQLTAVVQIQQEDLSLVENNQLVRFRLQDGEAKKYRANVNKIYPIIQSDTPGAAPTATVEILIDNEDSRLLLDGKGYAHIQTGNMRIYQKIGHELGKLFDFGRFLPWL